MLSSVLKSNQVKLLAAVFASNAISKFDAISK